MLGLLVACFVELDACVCIGRIRTSGEHARLSDNLKISTAALHVLVKQIIGFFLRARATSTEPAAATTNTHVLATTTRAIASTTRMKPTNNIQNHLQRRRYPHNAPPPKKRTHRTQVLTHKFRVKICLATSKLLNAFLVNKGLLLVMHILNTRVQFVMEERSPLPFAQAS